MENKKTVRSKPKQASTHDYRDTAGTLMYQMVRYIPKRFRMRRPDETNPQKWIWNSKGIVPLPYHVELWYNNKDIIFIANDELAVEAIEQLGLTATCVHGGDHKFYPELAKWFKDRSVVILPPNDNLGRTHAELIATRLQGTVRSIRILHLPDLQLKGDVRTWINSGGQKAELWNIAKACQPYTLIDDFPQVAPQPPVSARTADPKKMVPGAKDPAPLQSNVPMPPFSWPHISPRGLPLNTVENMECMLTAYGIKPSYNVIQKDIEVKIPGTKFSTTNLLNCSLTKIHSLCELNGLKKDSADSYISLIADDNHINPVLDWIMDLDKAWDGKDRLKEFYDTIEVKKSFPKDMRDLLMRKWMISACAAAEMTEGYIGKGVLVFQGGQNVGKTAWLRSLVPKELIEYVKDDVFLDPGNKDSVSKCVQHWIVELGELDGNFRKADIARIKGFISSSRDVLRRPYDKKETRYPRKTTFFATVNEQNFLVDTTGNARFWVIPVVAIHQHSLDMQQVWAEAMFHYLSGEKWWLDPEKESELERLNAGHSEDSPIQEMILKYYDPKDNRNRKMTATDVLVEIQYPFIKQAEQNDAGRVLRKYFGEPRRTKGRRWYNMPHPRSHNTAAYDLDKSHQDGMQDGLDLPLT